MFTPTLTFISIVEWLSTRITKAKRELYYTFWGIDLCLKGLLFGQNYPNRSAI